MKNRYTTLKEVETYLRNCELGVLEGHLRVLGLSVKFKPSSPYVCEECRKFDPSSPVISWLEQNKSEESWAELMQKSLAVAKERGLDQSKYFTQV